MRKKTIRIIRPAGNFDQNLLLERIAYLKNEGFSVLYDDELTFNSDLFGSTSLDDRLKSFLQALTEDESQILLSARGGYGCSDLLPLIPWDKLAKSPHKLLVGFSDISALLSAFWTKLAWPGLHAPMPASHLWGENSVEDIQNLLTLLNSDSKSGSITIQPLNKIELKEKYNGWVFGGCLSVLCNLIGTPYFPNLNGAYLLLEETGESEGRINRYFNQLIQSGVIKNIKGIIWGHLKDLNFDESEVKKALSQRADIPMWESTDFGHQSPNAAFMIGASANINSKHDLLNWYEQK